jgi:flagellar assembly factor FliW
MPQRPEGADAAETITVDTRFGKITFSRTNIIDFPQGLIGMPDSRRFGLSPIPDPRMGQFMILQSLENLGLSFLVLPLQPGVNTVTPEDAHEACAALAIPDEDADFFTIVTLRKADTGIAVSVNLRAPIIVDCKSHIARQHVLANPRYPVRQPL